MKKLSKVVGTLEEDGQYSNSSLLKRYSSDIDEEEQRPKLDIIREIIEQNDWDMAPRSNINGKNKADVTLLLLYEYSTSLEKLTGGKVSYKDVLNKLTTYMGKLRYGDWKSIDSDVKYDDLSVTSQEFKEKLKNRFDAQVATIDTNGGAYKKALILYDINEFGINSGVNCRDINDLRQTMFHELTHIMEISKSKENEEEYFVAESRRYRNSKKESDGIYFTGVFTAEFDNLADVYAKGRIMHNQVTEGFVENISRKILECIGEKAKDPNRYFHAVKISQDVMDVYGQQDVITSFVTDSSTLIKELEGSGKEDDDFLHIASDKIMDASFNGTIPSKRPKTNIIGSLALRITKTFRADKDEAFNDRSNREFFKKTSVTKEEFKTYIEDFSKKSYCKKKTIDQKDKKELESLFEEYQRVLEEENEFFFDPEKGFKPRLARRLESRKYDMLEFSMDELAKGALKIMTKNALSSSKINDIRKGIEEEIEQIDGKEPIDG